jgi:hypothetical protein
LPAHLFTSILYHKTVYLSSVFHNFFIFFCKFFCFYFVFPKGKDFPT